MQEKDQGIEEWIQGTEEVVEQGSGISDHLQSGSNLMTGAEKVYSRSVSTKHRKRESWLSLDL